MDIRADGYLSGVSCPSIQLLSHLDAFFIHPDIYNKNKKQNKQNFFCVFDLDEATVNQDLRKVYKTRLSTIN